MRTWTAWSIWMLQPKCFCSALIVSPDLPITRPTMDCGHSIVREMPAPYCRQHRSEALPFKVETEGFQCRNWLVQSVVQGLEQGTCRQCVSPLPTALLIGLRKPASLAMLLAVAEASSLVAYALSERQCRAATLATRSLTQPCTSR